MYSIRHIHFAFRSEIGNPGVYLYQNTNPQYLFTYVHAEITMMLFLCVLTVGKPVLCFSQMIVYSTLNCEDECDLHRRRFNYQLFGNICIFVFASVFHEQLS